MKARRKVSFTIAYKILRNKFHERSIELIL